MQQASGSHHLSQQELRIAPARVFVLRISSGPDQWGHRDDRSLWQHAQRVPQACWSAEDMGQWQLWLTQGHQQHSGRELGAQGAHAELWGHSKVSGPGAGDQQHARRRAAGAAGQRLRAAVGAPAARLCRPGRPPGILPSAPASGHRRSDSVTAACAGHAPHYGSVRQLRLQVVKLPPSEYSAGAAGRQFRASSGAWAAALHRCGHAIASHCRERLSLPLTDLLPAHVE